MKELDDLEKHWNGTVSDVALLNIAVLEALDKRVSALEEKYESLHRNDGYCTELHEISKQRLDALEGKSKPSICEGCMDEKKCPSLCKSGYLGADGKPLCYHPATCGECEWPFRCAKTPQYLVCDQRQLGVYQRQVPGDKACPHFQRKDTP